MKIDIRLIRHGLMKALPKILTGVGVVELVVTAITAMDKAPEVAKAIDNAKIDKVEDVFLGGGAGSAYEERVAPYLDETGDKIDLSKIKLTPWEYVKVAAPICWPVAVHAVVSSGCVIFANRINTKRYAAVLAALSLSEGNLDKLQTTAKEVLGKENVKAVKRNIVDEKIGDLPAEEDDSIICTNHGSFLFYEPLSNTTFRSSIEAVGKAINQLNADLMEDGIASATQLMEYLDIPIIDSFVLDSLCWHRDSKADTVTFYCEYNHPHPRTGEAMISIQYDRMPTWDR